MLKNLSRGFPSLINKRSFSTINDNPLTRIHHGSRTQTTGLVATVFGATGFTGRYLVQLLARTGIQVVVPYRCEDEGFRDLKVLGELGQIIPVRFDIRDNASIERAISHSNIVINMAGRDYETRNFSLEDINVHAASRIADLSKNVEKYIHVSTLRASEDSPSHFSRSKALGEKLTREIIPNCTVVRPSIIFGDEDKFINKWSKVAQNWPFIPRYNQEHKIQPLHCYDLASGILSILETPGTSGKVYEFAGDEVFTWDEFLDMIIDGTAQYSKLNIPVSNDFMKIITEHLLERFARNPNFIKDQIDYHNQDMTTTAGALTLKDLNVKTTPIQEKLIRLSRMYRPGKFFNAIANPQNK
ncbi:hypothetical protein ACTFIV_007450 [Dictyostelium citrinum]